MRRGLQMIPDLSVCLALALCAALLAMSLTVDWTRESGAVPEHVELIGSYSVAGGAELPYAADVVFDIERHHTVVFKGHLSRDVEKNEPLQLRINKLRVIMKINGDETFSFGMPGTYPPFLKSAGNVWTTYISPGIRADDEIEFILYNVYETCTPTVFNEFFKGFGVESQNRLAGREDFSNLILFLVGVFTISFGFALLFIAALNLMVKLPESRRFFMLAAFIIGFSFFLFFDSHYLYITQLSPYPIFNQILDVMTIYVPPLLCCNTALHSFAGAKENALNGCWFR